MAWVLPETATRPKLLKLAFSGLARRHAGGEGLIHLVGDACAALWRPPAEPAAAAAATRSRPAEGSGRPSPFDEDVLERFERVVAAMQAVHPVEPHWYLGVLSTVPERQSQGLGARALTPVLAICDNEGLPAYLESSNARNLPFYWRQGFVQTGEIQVPGGPVLFPMWREPRPAGLSAR